MRLRKIRIVESIQAYEDEIHRRLHDGSLDKHPEIGVMVMTPDTFAQVFSPERIRLMKRIQRNDITSIYQLAKELGKPYEVVFRNIKYLEGLHLIKLTKKENRQVPVMEEIPDIQMFADVPA
jgi:predicted transcriptional regulator